MEFYTWISVNDSRILDFYIRHSLRDLYFSLTGPSRPFYILVLRHSQTASSYLQGPNCGFLFTGPKPQVPIYRAQIASSYLQGPLEEEVGIRQSSSICCWAEIFVMFLRCFAEFIRMGYGVQHSRYSSRGVSGQS